MSFIIRGLWLIIAFAFSLGLVLESTPAMALDERTAERRSTCLTPGKWMVPGVAEEVDVARLLDEMARKAVVLLGEQHDDEDHHRWQVQTLSALHARRPEMVIGFEAFPRRVQPVLDRWVAGELTVKAFLEQSGWNDYWSVPPEQYLPLFQFARINRIPMFALNVDAGLTKAITTRGWDAVAPQEREGVSRPVPPPEDYRQYLFSVYRLHADSRGRSDGAVKITDSDFLHFIESQTTWDRAMAEALAGRLRASEGTGKIPLVVGVMGSGHIRFGYGVEHQLRALGVADVGSLMPLGATYDCSELRPGLASAVFALPEPLAVAPSRPRLGVQLESHEGGVRIAQVMANSLAEKTGLKSGDRVLTIAGVKAAKVSAVVSQIRQQPPGTWLPLSVQRGKETHELVVKFPVAESD